MAEAPRIFVANRGEIALRAVRAARTLGMISVVGASAADSDSLAAKAADRCVVLGPPAAAASYLNADVLLHAALATGCTALYPGYGFLSERADFAARCAEHGIAFVGPTADQVASVGDKLAARALAVSAGVPVTPGSAEVADTAAAVAAANVIGYPVITKASAGGGGRGMVVARDDVELTQRFDTAAAAAKAAFGDGRLFLEHYVERARHIEVQVFGFGDGRVVHLHERDCSMQRRYQKMIEEAPAAVLPDDARQAIHAAATALLASIGYRSAGTVEFLYDEAKGRFAFLEVNARLQVEHPVSEAVTGIDLVQWQLRLATGMPLAAEQPDIACAGHAIEARILAEDPASSFAPSPGRITRWQPPAGPGIRVDSGFGAGCTVPPFYDSMIAKLIVHGDSRAAAVRLLGEALDQFEIEGIATNIPFLRTVIAHPDFVANRVDTRWLERVMGPSLALAA